MSTRVNAAWLAAAALALMWGVGLFGRLYWTPDEPREAALATSVSLHAAPLPSLAGSTFAEKPPLTYWLAGAALRAFGGTPAAARVPQLAYALLGFCAVFLLARRMLGNDAQRQHSIALAVALVFATSELVYQVQIWLDTDALLLAGVCVALAGMYHALTAQTGTAEARSDASGPSANSRPPSLPDTRFGRATVRAFPDTSDRVVRGVRLRGYLVMHVGLTLAFFGKNFAAWLVPVLAFLVFVFWERRWRELWRWELYLPGLLPLACIALWVRAVAAMPDGAQSLRVLFWNNLVGRALPVAADAQFNYASGHPNSPGGYLLQLPLDLLPWSLLALLALLAAWRGARDPGPRRAAWRFALCAALPGLALLSLATTARSIYAAPCMIGFVLLIGLWIADRPVASAAARRAFVVTAWLVALLALAIASLTLILQWTVERASLPLAALSVFAALTAAAWSLRLSLTPPRSWTQQLLHLTATWALLLSLGVGGLYGAMNRTQDVGALALRLQQEAGAAPLLLWSPDETTLALAQLYLPTDRWTALDAAESGVATQLQQRLQEMPTPVVVSLIPGSGWKQADWLAYLRGRATADDLSKPLPATSPAFVAAGLGIDTQVVRPGGRGYLLWRRAGDSALGRR